MEKETSRCPVHSRGTMSTTEPGRPSVISADRRDELFNKYLCDSGRRQQPAAVTATNGGLKVLNTTEVARKQGHRKRPRATRTTSHK